MGTVYTEHGSYGLELVQASRPEGSHYTCNAIRGDGMAFLRDFSPDDINYVFLSTSGVHGSYQSLDTIELLFDPARVAEAREEFCCEEGEPLPTHADVTFCALLPRMVTTFFGNAVVSSAEDVAFLRALVEKSIAGVLERQEGNRVPKPKRVRKAKK